MSCPLELEGLDSGDDSADAGRLIKVFASHGTSEMVIGFDEIEYAKRHHGGYLGSVSRSRSRTFDKE